MKRINLLREKNFKELKLWNYRTLLMFVLISIIIFLLLILVSGCNVDTTEYVEKKFTPLVIMKISRFASSIAATGVI